MGENNQAVFDINFSLEQAGGDKELLKEIIDILLGEYPKQLDQLQEAIQKNDASSVDRLAHTIKGAVANFGAEPARQAAFSLEKIGKSGDLSGATDTFNILKVEMEKLARELIKIKE